MSSRGGRGVLDFSGLILTRKRKANSNDVDESSDLDGARSGIDSEPECNAGCAAESTDSSSSFASEEAEEEEAPESDSDDGVFKPKRQRGRGSHNVHSVPSFRRPAS